VLPHIRFPAMNMEDVATFVAPSQMLNPGQLLEIFTFLGQPDGKKPKTSFPSTARAGGSDKWVLDEKLKSGPVTLSNKNTTARNTGTNHSYVLGTASWTKGVHCWRVTRDSGQTQWLLLGVSRKENHADNSSTAAGFYGVSGSSQRYFGGAQTALVSNFSTGPLDVQFDADRSILTILNLSNQQRHEVANIPKGTPLCAHFGPHSNQQITVVPIRVKDFGKPGRAK